jgi:hypothetical protein
MNPTTPPSSLSALSTSLWQERQLLELLLFKLEEEQLLLAAGRHRWLPHATREVEAVIARVQRHELDRAVSTDAAAGDLGATPGSSLRELARAAAPPWNQVLNAHHEALAGLVDEIGALAQTNRELLARGHEATRDAIDRLQGVAADDASDAGATSLLNRMV